jgi:hypothetical protein
MAFCLQEHPIMRPILLSLVLVCTAACAGGPTIRADQDPAADFSSYRTYNFVPELGTDRAGYSTLITTHFKQAISREMNARGYAQSSTDPDLLVNVFTSMRDETVTRSVPDFYPGPVYYVTRRGVYTAWPMYSRDISTTTYQVGTASIDVVDAEREQLIWEGVAEGRLTDRIRENPGPAIDSAVADIFAEYPVPPIR